LVIHILKLFTRGNLMLGAVVALKGEVQASTVVKKSHLLQG
jgi:Na+-transporting NADH:ubiquinone oxidoreductase subunit NqrA